MKTLTLCVVPLSAAATFSLAQPGRLNTVGIGDLGIRAVNQGANKGVSYEWNPPKAWITILNPADNHKGTAKAWIRFPFGDEEGQEERFFFGLAARPGPKVYLDGGWQFTVED